MRELVAGRVLGQRVMSSMRIASGAAAASSSVSAKGRMVACGHTYEQLLHWMHFVSSQCGTHDGDAALLVCGGAELELAVGVVHEGGDGQAVAVHAVDGLHDLA